MACSKRCVAADNRVSCRPPSCDAQCFYHLEEYDDALRLALGSGAYFDINSKSEYVDTMIGPWILAMPCGRSRLRVTVGVV